MKKFKRLSAKQKRSIFKQPVIKKVPKISVELSGRALFTIIRHLNAHAGGYPHPRAQKFVEKRWDKYDGGMSFANVDTLLNTLLDAHRELTNRDDK